MAEKPTKSVDDIDVDLDNLYREEVFTDARSASIRRLSPVTRDGSPDSARNTMYVGETSLMTQMGPVPVSFAIEADSLGAAFEQFPEGVKQAVRELNERAREMMRDEASRIVVPTAAPPDLGGGMPPGAGGSGKILLK